VTVTFEDSTTRDFTLDPRTSYTIISSNNLATISGRTLTANPSATGNGTVTVLVSFPGTYGVSATINVTVVVFSSFTLQAYPYPTYSGSVATQTLEQIHCSGVFQRAQARLVALFSDGQSIDVSSSASFASSNTSVASFQNSQIIVGAKAGTTTITGTYSSRTSNGLLMTFGGSIGITSLVLSNSLTSSTLRGVPGTTSDLSVSDPTILMKFFCSDDEDISISPLNYLFVYLKIIFFQLFFCRSH
jgi:hypothetical protein